MSNIKESEPKTRFPTFRRLFTWKMARRALIVFAVLATLTALFYAEENFRGKRVWDQYRAELEAQGVQLDFETFVPPPVPDEKNFAMTPLLAPLFDIGRTREERRVWRESEGFKHATGISLSYIGGHTPDTDRSYWHSGGRTDLAIWQAHFQASTNFPSPPTPGNAADDIILALTKYQAEIAELREASRRPFARANVNYDAKNPFNIYLPHYSVLRSCVKILELRAVAQLSLARSDEAMEDLRLMFYLAETASGDPFMISQLVLHANLRQCLRVIWEGLVDHRWSDAQLAAIQARLSSMDLLPAMARVLRSEQAAADKMFRLLLAEPELLPRMVSSSHGLWPTGIDHGPFGILFKLVPSGWYSFERKNYHAAFQKFDLSPLPDTGIRIAPRRVDSSWSDVEAMLDKEPLRKIVLEHRVLSVVLIPKLGGIPVKFAAAQNHLNLALFACALERHRRANSAYPETLSGLSPDWIAELPNDPLTGEPFKYRRLEGGRFDLYSVGWNLEDDGGEPGLRDPNPEKPDYRKGDWIWRYPR
jgi:hypothetical protein